jgi:hypothetical protein
MDLEHSIICHLFQRAILLFSFPVAEILGADRNKLDVTRPIVLARDSICLCKAERNKSDTPDQGGIRQYNLQNEVWFRSVTEKCAVRVSPTHDQIGLHEFAPALPCSILLVVTTARGQSTAKPGGSGEDDGYSKAHSFREWIMPRTENQAADSSTGQRFCGVVHELIWLV